MKAVCIQIFHFMDMCNKVQTTAGYSFGNSQTASWNVNKKFFPRKSLSKLIYKGMVA